ncbi:MAG TPA: nucleotide exchange factor GrpE [Bacilli bacterium]|nr:nucleotide exchange factor GrpE [Bacilli bacterium]
MKEKKEKSNKELEELKEKLSIAEEKVLRFQAEMINYRKRKDEEIIKICKYANEPLILELLPIIDNFERAINMDGKELDNELSKFLNGMKMVHISLIELLKQYGLKEIEALNTKFDPTYHAAVTTDKNDKYENDIITEVFQKGYILVDKVIRPAMVKVNKLEEGEMKNE